MRHNISALAFCYLLCSACAPFSSDSSSLEQRVDRQEVELRQIRPQQADTWNEVQAMRQEINDLRGQLAAMKNPAAQTAPQPGPVTPEPGASAPAYPVAAGPAVPVNTSTSLEAPQSLPHAPDSSAYQANAVPVAAAPAPAAPQAGNYGLPPDNPAPAGQYQAVKAPSETTWGQADPKPQLVVPKKDISLALFDAGLNSYNSRDYAASEKSFKDFLKNYPQHSQAAEAQYYLAECQFQRNRFNQAALDYQTVIQKYPKSSVAADAYLKQGIAFSKMGQKAAATQRMKELINKFPNSSAASRAKAFLKTNK